MMVTYTARGGGEGEQVIHRGGQFERALVAVAHHSGDPLGIDHAGADHAGDLLVQGADLWIFRTGVVVVVDHRRLPRQSPHRDRQTAFELIVIVAVEKIVLAI